MLEVADPYGAFQPPALVQDPFPHFVTHRCLTPHIEAELLDWLDADAPWFLVETDFYEQFEFDLQRVSLPDPVSTLVSRPMLEGLRRRMEGVFGVSLEPTVQVVAHRLQAGQRIGIHNDMREGGETHRLTIQLNRGLTDDDGGFFMLFNSDDANDVHQILRPVSGSAIGFAISPSSHHAVSRVHGGFRYTLVYSFRAIDPA